MRKQIRRRFVRWQIGHPAKLKVGEREEFDDSIIHDLSFMGIKLSLSRRLPEDNFLKLRIMLSWDCYFSVEAWVAWSKTIGSVHCYGLYFAAIKDVEKERIRNFIYVYYPEAITKQWWAGLEDKGGVEMDDRRIFARFPVNIPLNFLDPEENQQGQAMSFDISAKGVGLTSKRQFKLNAPLELWLQVPDKGEPLYTRGKVAWLSPVGGDEYKVGVNLEKADLLGFSRIMRLAK